jgi:hypothetical protein
LIIKVEDITPAFFDSEIKRPIVAFLGSGVSIWEPTNLPTGKAFGSAIFRALFHESGKVNDSLGDKALEELFSRIPFEIVMEQCPEPHILTELLIDIFNVTEYNDVHRLFAEALVNDCVAAVVTTNYDCCIERALGDILGSPIGTVMGQVRRVVDEKDATSKLTKRVYFKIHGSADDPSAESLVFRLQHESVLPTWKRSLLKSVIEDRTLLLIGYSGLDFELCPEIPLLRPAQVLWNVISENEITPNARRILQGADTALIAGDMRILLAALVRRVNATLGKPTNDIEALVRSRFGEPTLRLWRARLLNSLSYGKAALVVIEDLMKEGASSATTRPLITQLLDAKARAFHYIGAYKRAAHTYEALAKLASTENVDSELVFNSLLAACDNWRSYGAFRRSCRRLHEAEAMAQKDGFPRADFVSAANLKRILLLRRSYQIAEMLRVNSYKNRLKAEAEVLLRSSAEAFFHTGRWFELQQLRLWADRFGLPAEVARPLGFYEPPPSRDGYEHLAFPMAQMMVFRDELDSGSRPVDKLAADEAIEKLQMAENLGLRTEAWKLSYLLLKKFPEHRNVSTFKRFLRNFFACEYSVCMRGLLLIIRP